ncbi:LPFR motif small protein [Streptomyces sp. NPDC050617]
MLNAIAAVFRAIGGAISYAVIVPFRAFARLLRGASASARGRH